MAYPAPMGESTGMQVTIRDYLASDARQLTDIFHDTIHSVGLEHYTAAEAQVWAPLPVDYEHWQERLNSLPPMVAEVDGVIAGFITLEPDGHIHWTYTHKDYQRRGVASTLYRHLEELAQYQGIKRLHVEASRFAQPFFSARGFATISEETLERDGQLLRYMRMEKHLVSS
ncbi:MAG: putative acetyltransferase [Planctomycetota bacterium]|jgi:putative acetyltransferase